MSKLIDLYSPANAAALTPEQLENLQKLTSAEIKELAVAFPNITTGGRHYLLIIENTKPIEKQIPHLSTFENLWNLREKNNLKQWVAYAFRGNYKPKSITPVKARRSEVLDLSETELMNLPGFKNARKAVSEASEPVVTELPETVKVTKVKKEKIK